MSAAQSSPLTSAVAFDALAADYDRSFTQSTIGGLMRRAVWQQLDACFHRGDRVLELNCGTGEDALHLAQRGVYVLATDVSKPMLEIANGKIACAGMRDQVMTAQLDLQGCDWANSLIGAPSSFGASQFDGAFSNFGGLNCVADLRAVAHELSTLVKRGGRVLLCVMGPLVVWEWVWYLPKAQPAKAFRRLRRNGVPWRGMHIRYPSIATLKRAFATEFKVVRVTAVGALVPPSYAKSWAQRHPRALAALNRIERRFDSSPLLTSLADHYLMELEKSS